MLSTDCRVIRLNSFTLDNLICIFQPFLNMNIINAGVFPESVKTFYCVVYGIKRHPVLTGLASFIRVYDVRSGEFFNGESVGGEDAHKRL